jgi:signal transduction histidine kinase
MFETGIPSKLLEKKLEIENQVVPRDMRYIIANQSPDLYRSIVELTSNAIDFSEGNEPVKGTLLNKIYMVRVTCGAIV